MVVAAVSILLILIALLWPKKPMDDQGNSIADATGEKAHSSVMPPAEVIPTPRPVKPVHQAEVRPAGSLSNRVDMISRKTEPMTHRVEQPAVRNSTSTVTAASHPAPTPDKGATIAPGFYIQVGSFKNKEGAQRVVEQLRSHSWSTVVVPRGDSMHAVQVGPYPNRPATMKAREGLLEREKLQGFIVQH